MSTVTMLHEEHASLPFLASLGNSENAESRRILLRITTDHFLARQDHSSQQLAQFEKTMLRLIARADPGTRLIVARKLASHSMAPRRVLETIEDMGGDAALYLLECAPLPRDRLVAAASGNEGRACALARRVDLDSELIAVLSLRPEPDIARALAGNIAAPLDPQTCAALARRAEREEPLADTLLARPAGSIDPGSLFLLASSERRASILAAAQRAELGRSNQAPDSGDHAETITQLERHALARQPELFVNALAQALGCGRDLAERIAREPSGEPLAVAVKALDARQDVAVRILISGDYTRIGSLIRLVDGLTPGAARRVIDALIGAPRERRAHRETVLDPQASPAPSRAAPASAAVTGAFSAQAIRRQRSFDVALDQLRVQKSG
jgi:uncharacterized protein (DUF2336 family)